jgi:hypothetical protein
MDLKEVGCGIDWLELAVGYCERGNEPSGSIKCGEFPD